jgi:hypothetical protein
LACRISFRWVQYFNFHPQFYDSRETKSSLGFLTVDIEFDRISMALEAGVETNLKRWFQLPSPRVLNHAEQHLRFGTVRKFIHSNTTGPKFSAFRFLIGRKQRQLLWSFGGEYLSYRFPKLVAMLLFLVKVLLD